MMHPSLRLRRRRPIWRAMTLVEVSMSIMIVGVMLVAALNTVGAARVGLQRVGDRSRGTMLAQQLMAEILAQEYEHDPDNPGSFGLDSGEVGDGSRALWEDVDDYNGWSASPPEDKNGNPLAGFDNWGRSVTVAWVNPNNPSAAVMSDTRVKSITVNVTHNGVPVANSVSLRSAAWSLTRAIGEGYGGEGYGGAGGGGAGGGGGKNNPPTADIFADPTYGSAPLFVAFDGSGSSDPDAGDTLTYLWDFGDGWTDEGVTASFVFFVPQKYTVTLTVTDDHGDSDTDTVQITAEGGMLPPRDD